MEGFLIRLPAPEHDTKSSASSRRRPSKNDAARFTRHRRVIAGRVLFYTLGEGYLTGYLSPTDVEPVEVFQLTSHTVDVDVMYSTQVFQVFARRLSPPVAAARSTPAARGDLSDSSDSSDDEDDEDDEDKETGEDSRDDLAARIELDGDYSVVFFAATKELVRVWSTRILNWNRYVFSESPGSGGFADDDSAGGDDTALPDAHEAVVQAFRASCVGDMFSPRVQLQSLAVGGDPLPQTTAEPVPPPATLVEKPSADAEKSAIVGEPPSRPWWALNAQTRRISSHSLHR